MFYFPPSLPRGDVPQQVEVGEGGGGGGAMTIKDALKEVLSNALCHDGVARGLREAVKALDK